MHKIKAKEQVFAVTVVVIMLFCALVLTYRGKFQAPKIEYVDNYVISPLLYLIFSYGVYKAKRYHMKMCIWILWIQWEVTKRLKVQFSCLLSSLDALQAPKHID